jgi:sec-independent protein translocase protein TatA
MFASPWKDGVIVLVIVLLFFGPKRLPALSRSIGESIKEFKGGIADGSASDHGSAPDQRSELHSAPSSTGSAPAAEQRDTSATSQHTNV